MTGKTLSRFIDSAIKAIRHLQKQMTSEERKAVWSKIAEGYCRECGEELPPGKVCSCCRDD